MLIEKFEKIGESRIRLQQEMEQMNDINLNSFRPDLREFVERIENEDFTYEDFNKSEVMRKKDILQALSEIESAIEKLKKSKEVLQQLP